MTDKVPLTGPASADSLSIASENSIDASMASNHLDCLRCFEVLRRLAGRWISMACVNGESLMPRIVTSPSQLEWKPQYISPSYKHFIALYEYQEQTVAAYRKSLYDRSSVTAVVSLQRHEIALWLVTLSYGIFFVISDYSFWTERFLIITSPYLMLKLVGHDMERGSTTQRDPEAQPTVNEIFEFAGGLPHQLPAAVKVQQLSACVKVDKKRPGMRRKKNANKNPASPSGAEDEESESEWELLTEEIKEKNEDFSSSNSESENEALGDDVLQQLYRQLLCFWVPKKEDILSMASPKMSSSLWLSPSSSGEHIKSDLDKNPFIILEDGRRVSSTSDARLREDESSSSCLPRSAEKIQAQKTTAPYPVPIQDCDCGAYSIWRAVKWELDATKCIVKHKPKNYQVWNHRLQLLTIAFQRTQKDMAGCAQEHQEESEMVSGETPVEYWFTQKNYNHYLQKYHHPFLSFETDFDERPFIVECLESESPKNYHVWLYRHQFLKLFSFLLRLPDIHAIQAHLGVGVIEEECPEFKGTDESITSAQPNGDENPSGECARRLLTLLPPSALKEELDFCDRFISLDVFNNSPWSHRMNLFHHHILFPIQQKMCKALVALIHSCGASQEGESGFMEDILRKFSYLRTSYSCTVRRLCEREVCYSMTHYESDVSNECPLTHSMAAARLYQSFELRLHLASNLCTSFFEVVKSRTKNHNKGSSISTHMLKAQLKAVFSSLDSPNLAYSRWVFSQPSALLDTSSTRDSLNSSFVNEESVNVNTKQMDAGSYCFYPGESYLSELISWDDYIRTFDLVFMLYHSLQNTFEPLVQKSRQQFVSLLKNGTREAMEEIRSTFQVQMKVDNLSFQCSSALHQLLHYFLEQTWLLYFPRYSLSKCKKTCDAEAETKEVSDKKLSLYSPLEDVEALRPIEAYARNGVSSDMLSTANGFSSISWESMWKDAYFDHTYLCIPSISSNNHFQSVGCIRKSDTGNIRSEKVENSDLQKTMYQGMIQCFLFYEASALRLAKELYLKDSTRSKYWRNEIRQIMLRKYGF